MTTPGRYDVIIVGCGPVGVVAAHLLGSYGIATLVVERGQEPYDLPRAIHLDHEIMRIFQSVGLAERLLPQLSIPAGAMHFGADRGVIRQFQKIVKSDRLGWASDYFFYQPDLERTLRASLAERPSVTVLKGHEVQSLEQNSEFVTVMLGSGQRTETATAQYVLACDGGRSSVRRSLGVGLDDLGFDEAWIVVDTLVDTPVKMPALTGAPEGVNMQDVMFIIGDPARPTSVIPGVGNHRRWEFMMLPGETPEQFTDPLAVKPLLSPWVGDGPYALVRCAVYRFHALLAKAWRQGRVFLAGDAAHQTPPFFGQGLCHGIRDVANWAWKIKLVLNGTATSALLDTYEVERLPQVRAVVEASMRVGRYICTLDPELAKRRDEEMRAVALRTAPGYVDIIPALAAGLLDDAGGSSTAAGSRFIQSPVLDKLGVPTLLDYATGGGFVMLDRFSNDTSDLRLDAAFESAIGLRRFRIVTKGEAQGQHANTLVDHTGELTAWFDHFKCQGVLVRPDAYVFGTYSTSGEGLTLLRKLRDGVLTPLGARLCVSNGSLRESVND